MIPKQAGILAPIRPDVERLRRQGFNVSQAVTDAVLAAAGEVTMECRAPSGLEHGWGEWDGSDVRGDRGVCLIH